MWDIRYYAYDSGAISQRLHDIEASRVMTSKAAKPKGAVKQEAHKSEPLDGQKMKEGV